MEQAAWGIGQDIQKENVDPVTKSQPARKPRAKKVFTVKLKPSSCVSAHSLPLPHCLVPDTKIFGGVTLSY